MSLLDIEENEVKTKPHLLSMMAMGFSWSRNIRAMKMCCTVPNSCRHLAFGRFKAWSILFWDKGTEFKGKKLRMNRVQYRIPKVNANGTYKFEKKILRNISEKDFVLLIEGIKNAWVDFDKETRAFAPRH